MGPELPWHPSPAERAVRASLVAELSDHVRFGSSAEDVAEQVRTALEDLRGSVSAEALPEMAARLALHRLADGARAEEPYALARRSA